MQPSSILDGSIPPQSGENDPDLLLAARYAPHILFDEAEPFLPLVVGITVFHEEGSSPSFPRRIERWLRPAWSTVIEYAIWWDWDIGHLYELEHAWSYVGADGQLVWAEASWHGSYSAMVNDGERIACNGDHPLLYSQPGKHAFVPEPVCLRRVLHFVMTDTGPDAGEGGVLVKDEYREKIAIEPGDHERAAHYLQKKAFIPTMRFTQAFNISRQLMVPWPVLEEWIPARVNWWLAQLREIA